MSTTLRNFLIVFASILLFSNCAKRGTPSGGPKDSIPPTIVKSIPENYSINFSGDEIRIYFDEYIKLKDIQKNLIISPPLKYPPIITPLSTSKVLKIKITDTLKENTTYSFNFGKAIVDNNEENDFEYFKFILSTGSYIDSLTVSGTVKDALLAQPDTQTTIMLYELTEDFQDSLIYSEKPTYITVTKDSTQNFQLTNLKEGNYLMLALQESNSDYTFQPKNDKIGFVNDVVATPNDSSYVISIFKEFPDYAITRPYHVSKNKIIFGFEGKADSLEIVPITQLPTEFESTSFFEKTTDSLNYFFKPAIDIEVTDTLLFLAKKNIIQDTVIVRMRDLFADSLVISRLGSNNIIPRDTIKLKSNNPLISFDAKQVVVRDKDSMVLPATTYIDRKYNIASILFDKKDEQLYTVEVFPNALTDFFENTNDTLVYGFRTSEVSDYGELNMTLVNVPSYPIIVEVVNSKYKVVARKYLTENGPLYFDYLNPDQYYFRIIYDENENGIWDTGSFLKRRQPEEIVYFPKQIEVRPNHNIIETFKLN